MTTAELIKMIHPNGISLTDILEDGKIVPLIGDKYLPKIIKDGNSLFMKPDDISIDTGEIIKIFYVYADKWGKVKNDPSFSYVQIPPKMNGYLVRIELRNNMLIPDYIIDVSNVQYRIETTYDKRDKDLVSIERMLFLSEDPTKINDFQFYQYLLHADDQRSELRWILNIE